MDEKKWLAERFEENRDHLRAVAYRMLGSANEAEDAVQEAWLRLSGTDESGIANLGGWLTTVVARICLDMLRARKSRREDTLDDAEAEPSAAPQAQSDPEREAMLADSVGLALLVVLKKLEPAERIAFVLHDMFDLPFDEIAPVVGRSPAAARQLASRARRRVRGTPELPPADLGRQRAVVDAFLAAARSGDFDALVAVLDPDVVLRADRAAVATGASPEDRGPAAVARRAIAAGARTARPALVDGAVGVVVAPQGRLLLVLDFKIADGKVTAIDVIAEPQRLRELDLAILDD